MAKDDRILLRRTDGSGAGVIFKSRKEVNEFVKNNPGYVEESAEETEANQKAADEQVAAEAEAKAQGKAEDKAVAAPKRS